MYKTALVCGVTTLGLAGGFAATAEAAGDHQEIRNEMSRCNAGSGPALMVTVDGVKSSEGKLRIQSYRDTADDWLKTGKWINRIEVPAHAGTMTFCLPMPGPGTYAVAVRHDVNGNGKTDISTDGGAMSNNPSINIFNLGKPSYTKVGVPVGPGVKSIRVTMKYM
ncbi:DUF2141 domain-containing protein [Novosphingobium sp. 9]|uniref:DUF2141 domain-containing protein n=1 Tax=Novosphingobium sp. 9 TaxID=2025349 RepID=UPI0021B62DE7|nr:DUF2141 domain-containing protein [Novosphingobium sp. 9]